MNASTTMPERDTTKEFFDVYAPDFNAIYGERNTPFNTLLNKLFRKSMMLRFQKTLNGCRPIEGKRVLNVGCGPGHYSVELAKRGAGFVQGIDFAQGMIDIARGGAESSGVADRCRFEIKDVNDLDAADPYDYVVVMGFMDYVADPKALVSKLMKIVGDRAFFSFPAAGGLLAWQRQLRYKKRCPLYLYTRERIQDIFSSIPGVRATIEPIDRDFFVTASAV